MYNQTTSGKPKSGLLSRVLGKKPPATKDQAPIPPIPPLAASAPTPAPSDADLWAKAAKEQDPGKKIADLNAMLAAQLNANDSKHWAGIIGSIQPQIDKLQFGIANPPTRLPTESDKSTGERRSIAEQRRRRGRASTILTEDKLGA